jgi:deoxyribodipyrimidine photo-lyase
MTINPTVHHVDPDLLPSWLLKERTRVLTTTTLPKLKSSGTSVVYWMQRDVRTVDNWALLLAMHLAQTQQVPLHVVYVLPPAPPEEEDHENVSKDPEWLPPVLADMAMTERHGLFLLGGLEQVHEQLQHHHVPLHVLLPTSPDRVGQEIQTHVLQALSPQVLVCDMTPIRFFRQALEQQTVPLCQQDHVPVFQVDAHNVVPVWTASLKREVGARTLRPKLHKVMTQYLTDTFPPFTGNEHIMDHSSFDKLSTTFDRRRYETFMSMDPTVPAVAWAQPGTNHAMEQFQKFLTKGLKDFADKRNDPNQKHVLSNMSPWINHGHVSFQRLACTVKALNNKHANGTAAYIEEGWVRRELSDNFLFYAPNDYDALSTAATWVQETLQLHAADERDPLYSCYELEHAQTYDDLWNAAQLQLIQEGKLHGFMRMYWAKKVLEWTASPEHALRIAQYLNDRFALDGRDPNGFVGVGWSIMGIHDMGWKERPIFGKVRYMNYAGCKRKFNVQAFVQKYPPAAANAVQAVQPKNSSDTTKSTRAAGGGAGGSRQGKKPASGGKQQTLPQAFSSQKAPPLSRGQKRKTPSK